MGQDSATRPAVRSSNRYSTTDCPKAPSQSVDAQVPSVLNYSLGGCPARAEPREDVFCQW